mgnify:CR=1 FL=1
MHLECYVTCFSIISVVFEETFQKPLELPLVVRKSRELARPCSTLEILFSPNVTYLYHDRVGNLPP